MRLQQLYEIDPVAAGQLMTELAAFLRAASISDRTVVSTLGEELALVSAYARVRTRLGQPDNLGIVVDGQIDSQTPDGRFPGAVLLPVIDRLLSLGAVQVVLHGGSEGGADEAVLSLGGAPGGKAFCADTEAHIRRAMTLGGGHPVTRRDDETASWLDIHMKAAAPAGPQSLFLADLFPSPNLPLSPFPARGALNVQRTY